MSKLWSGSLLAERSALQKFGFTFLLGRLRWCSTTTGLKRRHFAIWQKQIFSMWHRSHMITFDLFSGTRVDVDSSPKTLALTGCTSTCRQEHSPTGLQTASPRAELTWRSGPAPHRGRCSTVQEGCAFGPRTPDRCMHRARSRREHRQFAENTRAPRPLPNCNVQGTERKEH